MILHRFNFLSIVKKTKETLADLKASLTVTPEDHRRL
jgi:hypothetical protein